MTTCWEGYVCFFSLPHSQKGREFLTCKKIHTVHRRDVTCVDSTMKNQLVTGSIDNLICFWDAFGSKVTKTITIRLEEVLPESRGNTMTALKFADPNSNEQLLVFMSEGEVLCLDTTKDSFVKQNSGGYVLAQVKKFSLIDIKDGMCLSVSEKGEGCLHDIKIKNRNNSK